MFVHELWVLLYCTQFSVTFSYLQCETQNLTHQLKHPFNELRGRKTHLNIPINVLTMEKKWVLDAVMYAGMWSADDLNKGTQCFFSPFTRSIDSQFNVHEELCLVRSPKIWTYLLIALQTFCLAPLQSSVNCPILHRVIPASVRRFIWGY